MTNEEMEKAIAFILDQNAKINANISRLEAVQKQTTEDIQLLTGKMIELTDNVNHLEIRMGELGEKVDSIIIEMRDGFDKLILANEGTRNLAEQVAQLAISTSQRVTKLEEKIQ